MFCIYRSFIVKSTRHHISYDCLMKALVCVYRASRMETISDDDDENSEEEEDEEPAPKIVSK